MTTEASQLIAEFGSLSESAKREVLAELLRISRDLDYPEMGDDELTSAAEVLFIGYDEREAAE